MLLGGVAVDINNMAPYFGYRCVMWQKTDVHSVIYGSITFSKTKQDRLIYILYIYIWLNQLFIEVQMTHIMRSEVCALVIEIGPRNTRYCI